MEKNTTFYERILQLLDYYKINNLNNFCVKHLKYPNSEKIRRLKKEGTNPSFDILKDILNAFPDVSADWLVVGREPMIKKNEYILDESKPNEVQEIEIKYLKQILVEKEKADEAHRKYMELMEAFNKIREETDLKFGKKT